MSDEEFSFSSSGNEFYDTLYDIDDEFEYEKNIDNQPGAEDIARLGDLDFITVSLDDLGEIELDDEETEPVARVSEKSNLTINGITHTSPYLNKYEYVKIITSRIAQLEAGVPVNIETELIDIKKIAELEFEHKKLNYIVLRKVKIDKHIYVERILLRDLRYIEF